MGSKRKRQTQEAPSTDPVPKKHRKDTTTKSVKTAKPAPPPKPRTLFLSDPKGTHLKSEVQLYDQLGSEDAAERLEAADAVVSGLLGGGDLGPHGVEEATLKRHLERRLMRGLASGRKGARLGFSVVVTEILSQVLGSERRERYPGLGFEALYEILKAKTKPDGDLSGQEQRDHAFGLLFGLQSFVRARILFGSENGGAGRWNTVLGDLLLLAKKKPWIREECGWVIVEALEQMSQVQAEDTLVKIIEAELAASPEGVGVWLAARKRFPDMKVPRKPWGSSGNPLDHLKMLGKALKESSSPEGVADGKEAKPTGNWNPQLHFVWNVVLDQWVERAKSNMLNRTSDDFVTDFAHFWKVAVDENLFSESASRERKFWGFLVFQKMLQEATPYSIILEHIFSRNLMRCLINQLSNDGRFLHRGAKKSLQVLQQTIEKDNSTLLVILPRLIGEFGAYNFDQITKTKTVDSILKASTSATSVALVGKLRDPVKIIETSEPIKDADSRRQLYGDYLLTLVRNTKVTEDVTSVAWLETALQELASLSYSIQSGYEPALSDKSRTIFKNRLASSLAHLLSNPECASYPARIVGKIVPSAIDMDIEIRSAGEKAAAMLSKLVKKAKKTTEAKKKPFEALSLLYSLVILQLYSGEADSVSVLEELKVCYDKLVKSNEAAESGAEASVVLVEILLSFMSKPSVLLRKAAQQVFTAFCDEITEEGLTLITDVLDSSESLKGQQELFDQNDDDEDMDIADSEDDEMDSDVEVIESNGVNTDPDSSGEDAEDNEKVELEEEEDDENARKLDDALAQALGTHRTIDDSKEESSDSDADMSDSEMMALDSKLVEIFSQLKKKPNKKKDQKDAREYIVNFKSRALDLLEIYMKQASSPLAFGLLLPLLKLMRTTTAKHISDKAHSVITVFAKASKDITTPFDIKDRIELLKNVHAEASKDPSRTYAKAASTASLLISASLVRENRENLQVVVNTYGDTTMSWLSKEPKLPQASFFHDWLNWCQSLPTVDK